MKEEAFSIENDYSVRFLLLEDYNRLEKQKETLAEDEVLIYCSGADFDYDSLEFSGKRLAVDCSRTAHLGRNVYCKAAVADCF